MKKLIAIGLLAFLTSTGCSTIGAGTHYASDNEIVKQIPPAHVIGPAVKGAVAYFDCAKSLLWAPDNVQYKMDGSVKDACGRTGAWDKQGPGRHDSTSYGHRAYPLDGPQGK